MTLRLTVDEGAWRAQVCAVAGAVDGLLPVVKGNGYGFGRGVLLDVAARLADLVCVGTVHELEPMVAGVTPVVLTPTRQPPASTEMILTVGGTGDIDALAGWHGRIVLKLRSSMRRFGVAAEHLAPTIAAARRAGLEVVAAALHLPLAGDEATRRAEVDAWLDLLEPGLPLWVSHLTAATYAEVRAAHPDRPMRLRLGTALWHGDKSCFGLHADVLAVDDVRAGDLAGYRLRTLTTDGTLAVLGAGTANGVALLPGDLSPFHFARRRLALVEPPHMHSATVVVPTGEPAPDVGDWVDVQQPLIAVHPDVTVWA